VWAAVPTYIKIFLYSSSSSVLGLWAVGALDLKAVAFIVAANLGIYQVPRTIGTEARKIIK